MATWIMGCGSKAHLLPGLTSTLLVCGSEQLCWSVIRFSAQLYVCQKALRDPKLGNNCVWLPRIINLELHCRSCHFRGEWPLSIAGFHGALHNITRPREIKSYRTLCNCTQVLAKISHVWASGKISNELSSSFRYNW